MRSALAAVLAAGLTAPVPAAQSNMAAPEKFTAFAVDISNTAPRARTSAVDITIKRWSTDAERDGLLSGFRDKGQDALRGAHEGRARDGTTKRAGPSQCARHTAAQQRAAEGARMVLPMT